MFVIILSVKKQKVISVRSKSCHDEITQYPLFVQNPNW